MKIRELGAGDLVGLLECLSVFGETKFDSPAALDKLHKERGWRGISTFVAEDDSGRLVGTYSVLIEPKFLHGGTYAAHVEDVAVLPDLQGQGIGRLLMAHAIEFCRGRGCYKIVLYCDPSKVGFYEKLGFCHSECGMWLYLNEEDN